MDRLSRGLNVWPETPLCAGSNAPLEKVVEADDTEAGQRRKSPIVREKDGAP